MSNCLKVRSKGTLNTTEVMLNGKTLEDLVSFRLYHEPGCAQIAVEFTYLFHGSLKRFHGMNEGDTLDFSLDNPTEALEVRADQSEVIFWAGVGTQLFKGAMVIVEITADGWRPQISHWYDLKKESHLG